MHETVWRRLFTALLGLWFTAYAAEPAGLVACPMHGGTRVVVAHAGDGGPHGMAHASHHGAAGTTTAADAAPNGSQDHGAHHCTCLGHCCGTTVAVFRVERGELLAAAALSVARPALRPATNGPAGVAPHTLPYATAPPVA